MFKKLCGILLVFATLCTLFVNWASAETEIVNLYHPSASQVGFYNKAGEYVADNKYRCSPPLRFPKGM